MHRKSKVLLCLMVLMSLSNIIHAGGEKAATHKANQLKPKQLLLRDSILSGSLEDSLIGSWELTNVNIPEMTAQMASVTSQDDKDNIMKKMRAIQDALIGMEINFKRDFSIAISLHGQNKTGNWYIDEKRVLKSRVANEEKLKDEPISIISIENKSFLAQYDIGEALLFLTYLRKE